MRLDVDKFSYFAAEHVYAIFYAPTRESSFVGGAIPVRSHSLRPNNIKLNYTILLRIVQSMAEARGEVDSKRESKEPVFWSRHATFFPSVFVVFASFELLSSFVNDLAVSVR